MSSSDGVVKKLFEKGYITQQQMDAVMAANPPGGDAVQLLISWGFATQEHVSLARCSRFNYGYCANIQV